MTGIQEQSRGEDANIPVPSDIAAVGILPQPSRESAAPESTTRAHQIDTQIGDVTFKFASDSHEYMREYIRNADQKAIFYFSVCSALLAFEHTQNWAQLWVKQPSLWSVTDFITCVAMIGLAVAATCFLFVVFPRLGGSPRGLIFFKSVASYASAEEYVSDVVRRSEANLASDKLRHCHELAKVANSKYSILAIGLRIGAVALVCSLFLLVAVKRNDGTERSTQSAPSAADKSG